AAQVAPDVIGQGGQQACTRQCDERDDEPLSLDQQEKADQQLENRRRGEHHDADQREDAWANRRPEFGWRRRNGHRTAHASPQTWRATSTRRASLAFSTASVTVTCSAALVEKPHCGLKPSCSSLM